MAELKTSFDSNEWVKPEWTELVLEQLAENEVSVDQKGKKYPRVRGLRRVGSFLANGVFIECDVISCSEQYAACIAVATLSPNDGFISNRIIASSMAEATPANVNNDMIAKHLLATAESRAEGRCWTKVLKLNCLTAEEMSLGTAETTAKADVVKDIDEENGTINSMQKKMINKKCKLLNIDANKFAEDVCNTKDEAGQLLFDPKTNLVKGTLSKLLASKVIELLGRIERGEDKVKPEVEGFVTLN